MILAVPMICTGSRVSPVVSIVAGLCRTAASSDRPGNLVIGRVSASSMGLTFDVADDVRNGVVESMVPRELAEVDEGIGYSTGVELLQAARVSIHVLSMW